MVPGIHDKNSKPATELSSANFETFLEHFIGAVNAFMQGVRAFFGYGESDWNIVFSFFSELFVPYFVGGLILGLIVAGLSYFVFRPIIFAYKVAKAKKRSNRSNRNVATLKRKSL